MDGFSSKRRLLTRQGENLGIWILFLKQTVGKNTTNGAISWIAHGRKKWCPSWGKFLSPLMLLFLGESLVIIKGLTSSDLYFFAFERNEHVCNSEIFGLRHLNLFVWCGGDTLSQECFPPNVHATTNLKWTWLIF